MQSPPFKRDSNFNQLDNQEKTQLTAASSLPGEFNSGDIIGDTYEIIALIGSGGMGHVYRVRHTIMHQEYALKTLSAKQVTELAWRRFQNEAQAIARMNHPNIVGIYNLGLHQGHLPFYVMDLLKGQTLLDILRLSDALSLHETLSIFSAVAAGLGYAHKKGIVHRDIKPGNIILIDAPAPDSSRVRIVDFGIAKLSGTKDQANQALTGVGEICGSPYYMSPEQCTGGRVDARSDIYSFGCTLFEALTGNPPFKGRNAMETMLMHQSHDPPTLKSATGRQYPPMLEEAVATMLAKAPMDRYQNMERIIQDLSTMQDGKDQAISPYTTNARPANLVESKHRPDKANASRSLLAGLTACTIIGVVASGLFCWLALPKQAASIKHFDVQKASPARKPSAPISNEAALFDGVGKVDPGIADQSPSDSLRETAPFSKDMVKDGAAIRRFNFPDDFTIGKLYTKDGTGGQMTANGQLDYAPDEKLEFMPIDRAMTKYPQYLRRFRAGDIYSVVIKESTDPLAMIEAVSLIKGIKALPLSGCPALDDSCITALSKMTSLTELAIEGTRISGAGLAHLPYLKKLHCIRFPRGNNTTALCQAVAGSKELYELQLKLFKVRAEELKIISALPNLDDLWIDGSTLGDDDLMRLAKIPHLHRLSVPEIKLTPGRLAILKTFPALTFLRLEDSKPRKAVLYSIQKSLPGVSVI